MRVSAMTTALLIVLAGTCLGQTDAHAGHAGHAAPAPTAAASPAATPATTAAAAEPSPRDPSLPPGEADAKAQLERSPRHGEFVDVKMASGGPVKTWIVYPERKDKAGVVIVIHEIFGLSDWIRGVADQLAREGFIAVAPDLISGHGPGGGGTDSAGSRDDVVKLIRGLAPEEVTGRLNAIREWAIKLPAANGKSATIGFCWGGGQSFSYAAAQPALNAAVVYYGVSPDPAALAKIKAPVLGLYGGDDARVDATIPPAEVEMKKLGKTYEPHLYEGAGHGFLRAQADREGANLKATRQAWPRTISFLRGELK
ncbi:MAG TPA: dienelactone hydrolase family protein [Thermoanaerobaculia bacterium]|nr:dienelactone hydrolase family protein [Thermoanaerobaculia bacterium]